MKPKSKWQYIPVRMPGWLARVIAQEQKRREREVGPTTRSEMIRFLIHQGLQVVKLGRRGHGKN